MSPDPFDQNPFKEDMRQALTFLRQQHLSGVDVDDENVLATATEQGRLLMGGGSIVLTGSLSLIANDVHTSTLLVLLSLSYTVFAIGLGYLANDLNIKVRERRVDRRYGMYRAFASYWIRNQQLMLDSTNNLRKSLDIEFRDEDSIAARAKDFRRAGVGFLLLAVLLLGFALVEY